MVDVGPLRVRAFRRSWAAGIVTALGAQLTAVVVPLQIYELSGSSACVGPGRSRGPRPDGRGGAVGRGARRPTGQSAVLLTTAIGIGVTSLLLWAQAWADLGSVGVLLVLVDVQQALPGADSTVGRAVTPRLLGPELLPAANALQSVVLLSAGIGHGMLL